MKLERVHIQNFRLLKDINVSLEDKTTVIVGRNNSGKTSLTELFRRLLADSSPIFQLTDFTLSVHDDFWQAFILHYQRSEEPVVRQKLPTIEATLTFRYDSETDDLGTLSDFVIDLEPDSTTAEVIVRYELQDGKIEALFSDLTYEAGSDEELARKVFFKIMSERVPKLYSAVLVVVDPNDSTNQKSEEMVRLKDLLLPGFISAQRHLDEAGGKSQDILGKILEKILTTARSEAATDEDKATVQELEEAVQGVQEQLDSDFNGHLNKLLPTLARFGYPSLNDPGLHTETVLDVERLLQNHTRLSYSGVNGIGLPEGSNGLGSRNLIYILFQLFEFFKSYQAAIRAPGVHLVFIEEPEAHLHPQMQEVFTRKISEIADVFSEELGEDQRWPVQFVVTTHSSHVANEAQFETIRYFLRSQSGNNAQTLNKDLRDGLGEEGFDQDAEFLRKYLTLTRCDLFFADKAILIEGSTERLLMPQIIQKIDADPATTQSLSTQYLSVIEVGGAYAHHFIRLLEFLNLRTLIITDIDTNDATGGKCKVADGVSTSNACIKSWFEAGVTPSALVAKEHTDKIKGVLRIAYEISEDSNSPCGRSFEDAFMLANPGLFNIQGTTAVDKAEDAWDKASKISKTDFALKYAIEETTWVVPRYIKEGLQWLANNNPIVELVDEPSISSPGGDDASS